MAAAIEHEHEFRPLAGTASIYECPGCGETRRTRECSECGGVEIIGQGCTDCDALPERIPPPPRAGVWPGRDDEDDGPGAPPPGGDYGEAA